MGNRILGTVLALLMLPLQAYAAFSQADLNELEQGLWQVRSEFHMYTVMEGHRDYAGSLSSAINAVADKVASLNSNAEGERQRALADSLTEQWRRYQKAASSNTVASKGHTDSYIIRDVNEIPVTMVQLITASSDAQAGDYDDLYALSAMMQRMTSEYLTLAADPFGGMASGSDSGRVDFAKVVPEFEQKLAQSRRDHSGNPAVTRALEQVDVKWRFLRESMVKFYENAVPFLIYRYTDQIVSTLQQTAAMQNQSLPAAPSFGAPQ